MINPDTTISVFSSIYLSTHKALYFGKKTNAICIGGSVSTSHDVFFTHLEAIENLINIEFPGVS